MLGRVELEPALQEARDRRGGVFTRREAIAAGYSPKRIRRLLASGQWCRLGEGAYVERDRLVAVSGRPDAAHALRVATATATLRCAPVASHESAARLHGLEF